MSDDFQEILAPPTQSHTVTVHQVLYGPQIPPQQRIFLYSANEWEGFIQEWAYHCLKKLYTQVQRFTGSGDLGIDIAGFTDPQKLRGVWYSYQCKHYDHSLQPVDVWPEIGKILWYTFKGEYKVPRRYYFIAPRGVGTLLAKYLADSEAWPFDIPESDGDPCGGERALCLFAFVM